jgi:DNA-binding response OmpR family regulator
MSTRRPTTKERAPLLDTTILLVEDEPLIALDLHAALSGAGASIIAAVDTNEALALIRRNEISAGVLDIGLGDRDCTAVCQALLHHGVPFIFYTGRADAAMLKDWPHVSVLRKPATQAEIIARVVDLIH